MSSKVEVELKVEVDVKISLLEQPSSWQKSYHRYETPKAAKNSDFMICVGSPTDELFEKQAEPVVVSIFRPCHMSYARFWREKEDVDSLCD